MQNNVVVFLFRLFICDEVTNTLNSWSNLLLGTPQGSEGKLLGDFHTTWLLRKQRKTFTTSWVWNNTSNLYDISCLCCRNDRLSTCNGLGEYSRFAIRFSESRVDDLMHFWIKCTQTKCRCTKPLTIVVVVVQDTNELRASRQLFASC